MKGEHMQNKKSVWSTILLIATFLMLASIVVSIVTMIVSLPTIMEIARSIMMEEAGDKLDEASIELALQITKTGIIVGLVFAVIIYGLEVLGGFLFSLKGRWGVFCIVIGVLGVLFGIFDLTDLGNGQNTVGTILSTIFSFAVTVAFCVASIMHYIENKKLREEETI